MEDPFYSVKRQVQEGLRAANSLIESWRSQTASKNPDAKKIASDLEESLANIDSDLDDLQETIEIVETNRGRYFSIDDNELLTRKGFISTSRGSVASMRAEITKPVKQAAAHTAGRGGDRERLLGEPKKMSQRDKLKEAIREDNDDFINQQGQRTQLIRTDQDQKLSQVHEGVKELTGLAISIRSGLEEEDKVMEQLETETEEADSQMKKAVQQVNELLDKAGEGCSWGIIGVLVVLLVVLIVVVFEM